MELIILGSGTSIPMACRASPAIVLINQGDGIVFDMGPGTLRQMTRVGLTHDRITHIFITHFHPDHTADLIHFLFVTRYFPRLTSRKPCVITGPEGLTDFLKKLRKAYDHWLDVPDKWLQIEERDIEKSVERFYNTYHVTSRRVDHTPHSLAYRVETKNNRHFVYSGDTGFCDGIIELSRGCDLLILECSTPENNPVEGHLTPSRAGRIATLSGAKKLVLTHFYPEVLYTDIVGDCRKTYSGELILGTDLLHISI